MQPRRWWRTDITTWRLTGGVGQPHLQAGRPLVPPVSPPLLCRFSTALRIASTSFIQVVLIRRLRIDALAYITSPCSPPKHAAISQDQTRNQGFQREENRALIFKFLVQASQQGSSRVWAIAQDSGSAVWRLVQLLYLFIYDFVLLQYYVAIYYVPSLHQLYT